MDPVQGLSRLMETLRQQMAESAKRLDAPNSSTRGAGAPMPQHAGRPGIQELRRRIQERLQAIEPGSPDRSRRARRVFLESVLAWEFGDQLLLDSQLDSLIDNIQEAMQSDPDVDSKVQSLLDELARH